MIMGEKRDGLRIHFSFLAKIVVLIDIIHVRNQY